MTDADSCIGGSAMPYRGATEFSESIRRTCYAESLVFK
jgi:hypothetical protein